MTRLVTLLGYAALALAAAGLELAARLGRGVTLGDALAGLLRRRPARLLLQAGWLWLGWHLFVRVHWR